MKKREFIRCNVLILFFIVFSISCNTNKFGVFKRNPLVRFHKISLKECNFEKIAIYKRNGISILYDGDELINHFKSTDNLLSAYKNEIDSLVKIYNENDTAYFQAVNFYLDYSIKHGDVIIKCDNSVIPIQKIYCSFSKNEFCKGWHYSLEYGGIVFYTECVTNPAF